MVASRRVPVHPVRSLGGAPRPKGYPAEPVDATAAASACITGPGSAAACGRAGAAGRRQRSAPRRAGGRAHRPWPSPDPSLARRRRWKNPRSEVTNGRQPASQQANGRKTAATDARLAAWPW